MCKFIIYVLVTFALLLKHGRSEVSENDLFPYDPDLDTEFKFGDDFNMKIDFSVGFSFFNATYNSTFMSGNGQVTFGQELLQYTPECSPGRIPMIMAFWGDAIHDNEAKLMYRESRNRSLLQKAATDIFLAFPQLTGIRLNWMLLVTWKNLSFFGASSNCDGKSRRNTFQLVLTTDGYYTFALMYYNKIEWTTGTTRTSGGDCRGLGGNPAKVGFDYGDRKTFYTVPGSCTDAILNITQTSNIHQPGKWVFRIDGNLETSTCDDYNFTTNKLLQFTPNLVSFDGFQLVKIKGPCLRRTANASCIFHDDLNITEVEGMISEDYKEIVCPLPLFQEPGRKKVELKVSYPSISGEMGDFQIHQGYLYVVDDNKEDARLKVSIEEPNNTNMTTDAETVVLNVTWNPTFFNGKKKVDIRLKMHNGQNWIELAVLKAGLENNGRWQGPVKKKIIENISVKLQNIEKRLFAITMSTSNENERFGKKLSSSLFTGVKAISESAPLTFITPCRREILQSPTGDSTSFPCPPTLKLAEIDDNFEQSGSEGSYVIKRQKVPSVFGGVSKCVYDSSGNLLKKPSGNNETHLRDCNKAEIFPYSSNNGGNYAGRIFAWAAGALHFSTFDTFTFTFNGLGEFWLLKFSSKNSELKFKAQARIEQYISMTDQKMNASVITAVAMEEETNGERVRVQVSSAQQRILVVVEGIPLEIDAKTLLNDFTMRHKSCSIAIKKCNTSQETVILTFYSGFSFQFKTIAPSEVALNIISSANLNVWNLTEGLLVKFAGRNDTTSLSTRKEIHQQIVSTWMIQEQDSLFNYRPGESYKAFHKPDFIPNFEIDSSQPLLQSVNDNCAQHKECIFDYLTTGSAVLANATRASSMEYNRRVHLSKTRVETASESPNKVDDQESKNVEQSGSQLVSTEIIYIIVYVFLGIILSSFAVLCVLFVKRQLVTA